MIPSLGKVQGVVALEAALQGNVRAENAFVYRIACESIGAKHGQEDRTKMRGLGSQVVLDHYAIIVLTKNIKDAGGNDSSDINDDITQAISIALLGWIPPKSTFPMEYVRGELSFQRNMLLWTEIYGLRRVLQSEPHHRITPMNNKLFYIKSGVSILKGMPIRIEGEVAIPATSEIDYHGEVQGLSMVDTAIGNKVSYSTDGIITLEDWTSVIGTPDLIPGVSYYLSPSGGMTTTLPTPGIVRMLGKAISKRTFDIEISDTVIEL
jgi:hypothetical protein